MAKFAGRSLFYLALENSVCEDYITEKLWRAVSAGAVPVVFDAPQRLFGGADSPDAPFIPGYRRVLPPGSYVNIANFSSADALLCTAHASSSGTAHAVASASAAR